MFLIQRRRTAKKKKEKTTQNNQSIVTLMRYSCHNTREISLSFDKRFLYIKFCKIVPKNKSQTMEISWASTFYADVDIKLNEIIIVKKRTKKKQKKNKEKSNIIVRINNNLFTRANWKINATEWICFDEKTGNIVTFLKIVHRAMTLAYVHRGHNNYALYIHVHIKFIQVIYKPTSICSRV